MALLAVAMVNAASRHSLIGHFDIMSGGAKAAIEATTVITPTEAIAAIRAVIPTGVSVFLWGPPGIAKSQISQQIATDAGIAFIDFRLSQLDPTDLRGIPYPTRRGGREGVRWSVPYALPEDLDFDFTVTVPDPTDVRVEIANPIGSNGIHYCTNPRIKITSLTKGAVAKVIPQYVSDEETGEVILFDEDGEITTDAAKGKPLREQDLDRVYVGLFDAESGEPVTGKFRIQVKGKVKAILGLEEFNSAPQSVAAAAYQFVLDRRLGEYIVPEGVAIMAMGNRDTDKGITYRMALPISNRFMHLEMKPNFNCWIGWAFKAKVHADVIGYLTAYKQKLFDFNPGTASRGFATPRSWEFVSKFLWANPDPDYTTEKAAICGSVGEGQGLDFMSHREHSKKLPSADLILSGKLKRLDEELDVPLEYALTTQLVYELMNRCEPWRHKTGYAKLPEFDEWCEQGDNFIRFLKNMRKEVSIMAVRMAVQTHRLPFHMHRQKEFLAFAEEHRNHVMV
jgi:MoxR-like ATPase